MSRDNKQVTVRYYVTEMGNLYLQREIKSKTLLQRKRLSKAFMVSPRRSIATVIIFDQLL